MSEPTAEEMAWLEEHAADATQNVIAEVRLMLGREPSEEAKAMCEVLSKAIIRGFWEMLNYKPGPDRKAEP